MAKMKEHELPSNIPDHDETCWTIGSETFTRQEVFKILFTQRAMISNDFKRRVDYKTLHWELKEILENPRIPKI